MRFTAVLSCLIISLATASTAKAHWYRTPGQIKKIHSVQWKIIANERNIAHANGVVSFFTKGKQSNRVRNVVRAHEYIIRYSQSEIQRLSRPALPPHYSAWLCIHKYEGAWDDSGDPYWGGLQMDRQFMESYAPPELLRKGWANVWTPLEQMWVAENAYRTRGFYPWPNTARYCGLI